MAKENKGVAAWLGLAVVFMLLVAVEIAGLTLKGWHTISWTAQHNKLVFWLILAAGLIFLGFWVDHVFLSGAIAK